LSSSSGLWDAYSWNLGDTEPPFSIAPHLVDQAQTMWIGGDHSWLDA
jgi:hypothetical protein